MIRVLCVDDDLTALRTLARTLSLVPELEVVTTVDPEEARSLASSQDFAVVITDYSMPSLSGVELLELIAADGGRAVPLLVTGQTDMATAIEAVNRGHIFALIHKPWRQAELLLMVRRACERYELAEQLRVKISELEDANEALRLRNRALEDAQEVIRKLTEVAATDDKTGARTHRFFAERLVEELARARRYDRPMALMLLDLDGFKHVNDEHGHLAGDGVLKGVADVVRSSIRVMDVFARYGGDEFAVILPDTSAEGAACLGGRLCDRVRETDLEKVGRGAITLSLGIAAVPEVPIQDARDLVDRADRALYKAKTGGKDRVVVASGSSTPPPST
ncbi:MAG: diguanylate cyclase [Polyangiaceae bacterium]